MSSPDKRLRAADFTAAHWHQHAINSSNIPAAHAIACIRAALQGETDPNQLGLDDEAHDAFSAALDEPKVDDSGPAAPNLVHPEPKPQASEPRTVDEEPALDEPSSPAATEATQAEKTTRVLAALHRSAEQDVSRVITLYERWVKAGPPLGTSMTGYFQWWREHLAELHDAIRPPAEPSGTGDDTSRIIVDRPFRSYRKAASTATPRVLAEIGYERTRQDAKFGEQNHPDGTGNRDQQDAAESARRWCQDSFGAGYGTWSAVLAEEVAEANAERDPARLRAELVQVAAVAVAWIEAIDRRTTAGALDEPKDQTR
ncbi:MULTISPECIES: hypothetical protein [unclassified Streptomyces]|uniref:hypothetical protein n=1 Tax=unclassified Streptomyces TaxID=2593676 RepID=UPI0019D200E0|nr:MULTISPECIES: hypothetical protein [unclassified Streptomyces]